MKSRFLPLALVFALVTVVSAAPPAWWSSTNTRVLQPGGSAENYAPANLGQLKHVAAQAKKHLDSTLLSVGGAGSEIDALVASFEPRQGQGYMAAQIAAFRAENYAPINLGQLKAVAKPFYNRLLALGYPAKANLIAHGYPSNWAFNYPWNPSTPVSENYATANLGQLKMVFSFEILDTDGDSIPDILDEDDDDDGLSDVDEIAAGTLIGNPDTDGDGDNDWLEVWTGVDPLHGPPTGDTDGDGVSNAAELNAGTNPNKKDNPAVGLIVGGFVTP